jgi:hypothetical protein
LRRATSSEVALLPFVVICHHDQDGLFAPRPVDVARVTGSNVIVAVRINISN